jgi:putative oxidoreductase
METVAHRVRTLDGLASDEGDATPLIQPDRFYDRSDPMGLATTTLRIGLGALMAGHGLQKLAGKFGGPGLDGAAAGFEQMGMSPGRPYATAAALTETVGGGLLVAGLFTPVGAAMVTGAMTVAIAKVHGKNGLWVTKGGMEYNLTLIGAAFAITEHGPGIPALDGLITKRRKGFGWALVELAAGVGGGLAVVALSNRSNSGAPLADKVSAVADHAGSGVSDAASSAADKVSDVADKVSGKASDVADTVSENAAAAADQVSEHASNVAGSVSDNGDSAREKSSN